MKKLNKKRIEYIKEKVWEKLKREKKEKRKMEGIRFIEIGWGGGMIWEKMERMGEKVIGEEE